MTDSTGIPTAPNVGAKRDPIKEAQVKQLVSQWLMFASTGVFVVSKDPGVSAVAMHVVFKFNKDWEEYAAVYWMAKGQTMKLNLNNAEMLDTLADLLKAEFGAVAAD